MTTGAKTREQLQSELEEMRRRVADLESAESHYRKAYFETREKGEIDRQSINNLRKELLRYGDRLEERVRERTAELEEKNLALLADIAQRAKMEEALKEPETIYRTIFENTGNATVIFDEDTTILLANAEFEKLLLYTREETEGKISWTDLVLEGDLARLLDYHKGRRIAAERVPNKYELKLADRQGFIHDVYMTVAMIPGTNKSVASIMDITPLKEVKKALQEREALYQTLFDQAGVAIVNIDVQGNYLHVNDNYAEFIGYSREELESKKATTEVLHPDYREGIENWIARQKSGEIDGFTAASYFIRKDGSLRWGEIRSASIRDQQGRLRSVVVTIIDGTERKKAEDKLREYTKLIEDLYQKAPCGYHSVTADGTILHMNDTELAWLGYSREEVIRKMNLQDFLTPEGKDLFSRLFPIFKEQGGLHNLTDKWVRRDGSAFDVLINANAVFDENGQFLMSRDSVIDITERKRVEEALAENEAMYRNLFENALIGMFQSTMEGKFLRINKAYARMLGYESPEEVISTIHDTATQIHADPRNRAELLSALNRQGWFYAEQPYLRKDGSIMIGKLSVRKVAKQDGAPAYLEGLVEDITERKEAEEALRKSERELRLQARNLMETNTTLKVLLDTMEKDREEMKERFLANIQEEVLPYLDKLRESPLQETQKAHLQIAENHLLEIASPFIQKLTSRFLNLTKKEIQIASLIKEGKTSKEIAELLNSKQRVIEFHRENIRSKLGLKKKKGSLAILLRSYA